MRVGAKEVDVERWVEEDWVLQWLEPLNPAPAEGTFIEETK